jgi:hypothetical protein
MEIESGALGTPTTWTLVQSGAEVTGTSRRVAPFVVSDTGTITGTVTGNDVTLTWVHVLELANPNSCNPSTTQTTATMVVTGDSMTGPLVTQLPVCGSRVFGGQQYTFTRQATPLPAQPPLEPITLSVTYRQGPPPAYQLSTGCTHHFAPSALFVNMDGLPVPVRLSPVGERVLTATIAGAWPGEQWITIIDINLCPPQGSNETGPGPYVTSGVSVNGMQLSRVIQLQVPGSAAGVPALAFNLSDDGTVHQSYFVRAGGA